MNPQSLEAIGVVEAFLYAHGLDVLADEVSTSTYGDSPELEQELLALIGSGRKTATSSLVWAYEAEGLPLPKAGDIEVVVSSMGQPEFATRITSACVVPFENVSASHARNEGEGDLSLEHWRSEHWEFFSRQCSGLGRDPVQSMPVVCTTFEVLNAVT